MRIVGGDFRGRILLSPKGLKTRPTSDRAREAIFNILAHARWLDRDIIENAKVLDIFAGTGALGLEALSRGAKEAVFVEQDREAIKACHNNIEAFGLQDRTRLLTLDALRPPPRPAGLDPLSLVFLDPPYGKGMVARALAAFADRDWLEPRAVCIAEMAKKQPEDPPPGFALRDERAYGVALVRFMEWTG
jgi:16S rRNA (guanine966-N2)-methyltransferase